MFSGMFSNELSHLDDEDRNLYKKVINASKEKLKENDIWYIFSAVWLNKWKEYLLSGYDSWLKPDPIDNSHLLQEDDEEQLKLDLVENKDYVLLPKDISLLLFEKWGGGPDIKRSVVNMDAEKSYLSNLKVLLFPTKIEIYIVKDKDKPNPILGKDKPKVEFSMKPKERVIQFFKNLQQMDVLECGYFRLWVKTTPKSKYLKQDEVDMNDSILHETPRPMTEAITDQVGVWKLLRKKHVDTLKICDLESFKGDIQGHCVEMIYEYVKANIYYQKYAGSCDNDLPSTISNFPRHSLEMNWKSKLIVGDIIDALNEKRSAFYEAKVKEIQLNGGIVVHFLGFEEEDDQICSDMDKQVAPLYSKTVNWRYHLSEYDNVELRLTKATAKGKWIKATVDDLKEGKVKVSFKKSEMEEIEECDRIDYESDTIYCYREVDIHSEEICKHGTHLQKQNQNDAWSHTKKTTYSTYGDWSDRNTRGKPLVNGAVGLCNLGNTCFMNSILQCLSHTKGLTQVFLDGRYKSQINRDNPLGHGGKVVEVYADLMKDIWSNNYTKISPYNFKHTIGEFKPQFSGYQQQDSQEFMSFLLDGLHEDLNRIQKKPYVKTLESKGRSDDTVAREALRRYLLRNDSEIVDLCFGQLRSHVICTNCGHESTTYDPYSSVSLPIPTNRNKCLSVLVYMLPYGSVPLNVEVEVATTDTVNCLKRKVLQKLVKNGMISNNSESENLNDDSTMELNTNTGVFASSSGDSPNKKKRLHNRSHLPRCYSVVKEASRSKYYTKCLKDDEGVAAAGLLDTDEYSKSITKMFEMEDESLEYFHVYLAVENITSDSYYNKINSLGIIGRLPIVNDQTNRQLYENVNSMVDRFIDKSHRVRNGQFTLHFGDAYRTNDLGDKIPNTEAIFDCKVSRTYSYTNYRSEETKDVVVLFSKDQISNLVESAPNETISIGSSIIQEKAGKLNLRSCFEKYTEKEQMNEEELFFCSKCKELKAPIKKLDLWSAPDILILHLKRFEYTPGQYFVHREKITDLVDYPIENLDLTEFVKGPTVAPPIYDLYAVSEHSGGLGGGHYTATCKNPDNNKWFSLNDSMVSETSENEAVSALAYVLFYKRKSGSFKYGGIAPLPEAEQLPDEE